jgi:DNA-binding Lrp family transcriptional regulator
MSSGAPFTSILSILQAYKQVTIDFLADQMGASRKSIEERLVRLEDRGIVRREGSIVRLINQAEERIPEP